MRPMTHELIELLDVEISYQKMHISDFQHNMKSAESITKFVEDQFPNVVMAEIVIDELNILRSKLETNPEQAFVEFFKLVNEHAVENSENSDGFMYEAKKQAYKYVWDYQFELYNHSMTA